MLGPLSHFFAVTAPVANANSLSRGLVEALAILGRAAAAVEPRDGAFDNPSLGPDRKAICDIGALDDLHVDLPEDFAKGRLNRALNPQTPPSTTGKFRTIVLIALPQTGRRSFDNREESWRREPTAQTRGLPANPTLTIRGSPQPSGRYPVASAEPRRSGQGASAPKRTRGRLAKLEQFAVDAWRAPKRIALFV
jgi:hypothetical protein